MTGRMPGFRARVLELNHAELACATDIQRRGFAATSST